MGKRHNKGDVNNAGKKDYEKGCIRDIRRKK
jgi:hypothetical protein